MHITLITTLELSQAHHSMPLHHAAIGKMMVYFSIKYK